MDDLDFMIRLLESDEIRDLYNRRWYPEALYLLAITPAIKSQHKL